MKNVSVAGKTKKKLSEKAAIFIRNPLHWVSLGFGSGLSPVAPGTAGTLFAWGVFALFTHLFPDTLTPAVWLVIAALSFALGTYTCAVTGKALDNPDDSSMVIDEIAAFWLMLALVYPCSVWLQFLSFVLFRFFDMVKPPPIRWFDERFKGGFGVMLDDIIAVGMALIVFVVLKRIFGF